MKIITKIIVFCLCISSGFASDAFEDGIAQASQVQTPSGHNLRYTCFESPLEGEKDTVVFVQGRGTFLEFYEIAITPFLERGLNVWMYDLTGQGGSSRLLNNENQMQHIDSFDLYVDDLDFFVNEVVLPKAEGKLFLGGYSTGGHVALRYLQQKNNTHPFSAAFMFSPLLKLKLPWGVPYLVWYGSWMVNLESYVPGAGPEDPIFNMPYEGNPYSSDEAGFNQIKELCVQYKPLTMGGVSYGWLISTIKSAWKLWEKDCVKSINIPVLIATGGDDGVVDVSYNEQFASELPKGHHIYYPTGRHELFRETEEIRAPLWAELDQFLYSNL